MSTAGLLLLAIVVTGIFFKAIPSGSQPVPRAEIPHRGPWIFGRPDAPYTIIEYADLECPYCRAYFPVLRRWIKDHPQVDWEWWNLPLSMHDPAAFREAVLAECVGEMDGNRAFWRAVDWIYGHTRGNGAGLPAGTRLPEMSATVRACLKNRRPTELIQAQAAQAAQGHLLGTPTLRVIDRETGQSLVVQGPVAGDSLLSAIDWLTESADRPALRARTQ